MKEIGLEKVFCDKMPAKRTKKFSLIWQIVPSWANQLLPQLLMEQFDMLPVQ